MPFQKVENPGYIEHGQKRKLKSMASQKPNLKGLQPWKKRTNFLNNIRPHILSITAGLSPSASLSSTAIQLTNNRIGFFKH